MSAYETGTVLHQVKKKMKSWLQRKPQAVFLHEGASS